MPVGSSNGGRHGWQEGLALWCLTEVVKSAMVSRILYQFFLVKVNVFS